MVIHYWKRMGGAAPVQHFIIKQKAAGLKQRMIKSIDLLEVEGMHLLKANDVLKQLQQDRNLYELKADYSRQKGRIILTFVNGEAWLLDAFVKTSPEQTNLSIRKSTKRRKDLII